MRYGVTVTFEMNVEAPDEDAAGRKAVEKISEDNWLNLDVEYYIEEIDE